MGHVSIPESCLLNAADYGAWQRQPTGWEDAGEERSGLGIHLLSGQGCWQLHQLHIHTMFLHLRSMLMPVAAIMAKAAFLTTILHCPHHYLV